MGTVGCSRTWTRHCYSTSTTVAPVHVDSQLDITLIHSSTVAASLPPSLLLSVHSPLRSTIAPGGGTLGGVVQHTAGRVATLTPVDVWMRLGTPHLHAGRRGRVLFFLSHPPSRTCWYLFQFFLWRRVIACFWLRIMRLIYLHVWCVDVACVGHSLLGCPIVGAVRSSCL